MNKKQLEQLKKEHDSFVTDEEKAEIALQHEKRLVKLKQSSNVTTKKYNQLLQEYDQLLDRFEFIQELDLASVKSIPIEPKHQPSTNEAVAVMVASDWHTHEVVDPKTVNGCNSYNPKIAEQSIQMFFTKGLKLVYIHRSGVKINKLILVLAGDLMQGQIHMEFLENTAGTPQQEIQFLYRQIISGIDYLLKNGNFDEIIIPCVDGNHGRATDKTYTDKRVQHSNEWLLYNMLAERYRNTKQVQFIIADGLHLYQEVYGYKIRIHHGDAMRYIGGVGGLTVPVNKAIANWNTEFKADLDIFGHFHTFFWGGKFISNGSLVGYNAYAKKIKAQYDVPKQAFILIDKKHFITAVSPIFVR